MLKQLLGLGDNVRASSNAFRQGKYLGNPSLNRATNPNTYKTGLSNFLDTQASRARGIASSIKSKYKSIRENQRINKFRKNWSKNQLKANQAYGNWENSLNSIKPRVKSTNQTPVASNYGKQLELDFNSSVYPSLASEIKKKRRRQKYGNSGYDYSPNPFTGSVVGYNSYLNLAEFSRPRLTLGCF